ncbi:MAG TPA: energy transducer TonB [Candidatus Dormibacteraeota bacterium]|nr:energy transducer TonB [Candidatus Dormibacteraeota bacterium]
MKTKRPYFTFLLVVCLPVVSAYASDACVALNLLEVSAALRGRGDIISTHAEVPEKKISICYYKRATGGPFSTGAALQAAPGPEVMLMVSDPGAPPLVDSKTMDAEAVVPSLGDRASFSAGPMSKAPGSRTAYRVAVITGSRSYALIYVPTVTDPQSRDIAVQLAREVLLAQFGSLATHPLAEQVIANDKMAVAQKPEDVELWSEIGLFSDKLKRYDDARDAYLKISQLLPDDPGGYYGVAFVTWQKVYPERMQLRNNQGLRPIDDTATDPRYRDLCDALRKDYRAAIEEGYGAARKALELRPDSSEYAVYASLMAREKAATDCGDPLAAKADTSDADHFAQVSNDNRKAEAASGKRYVSRSTVGLFMEPPPPPPPPPSRPGEVPGGAMGGVLGSILSTTPPGGLVIANAQRVPVSAGVESGLLITKVAPVYPQLARQARIQGTVTLQAVIDKDGNIDNLQLISGHPMLATAAIEAVKQWKYKPYVLNGQAVAVDTQIQVNFSLQKDPPAAGSSPPADAQPKSEPQ